MISKKVASTVLSPSESLQKDAATSKRATSEIMQAQKGLQPRSCLKDQRRCNQDVTTSKGVTSELLQPYRKMRYKRDAAT